jgi:hypothetical protein
MTATAERPTRAPEGRGGIDIAGERATIHDQGVTR